MGALVSSIPEPVVASYTSYPIDPKSEIRIIELLPPTAADPKALHCNFSIAKLTDKPQYEAISYVWGEPVFPERLYLPNGYLAITTNLAEALRRFRYPDRPRRLWADAVCINQADNDEKGVQVGLMSEVYRSAECGLCWLGEGDDVNVEVIKRHMAFLKQDADIESKLYDPGPDEPFLWPLHFRSGLIIQYWNAIEWVTLDDFFGRPWFDRLWVIQEFILPPKVRFYYGCTTFTPDEFDLMIKCIREYFFINHGPGNVTRKTWDILGYCPHILRGRRKFWRDLKQGAEPEPLAFPKLLSEYAFYKKKCYDDRDRIYGLLGLRHNPSQMLFGPNYNKPVDEVYIEFALYCYRQGNIDILHYIRRAYPENNENGTTITTLPTWCPDWRISTTNSDLADDGFKSATNLPASFILDKINLPVIGMRGTSLGTIKTKLSLPLPDSPLNPRLIALSNLCYQNLGKDKLESYHTDVTIEEAFGRTLLLDCRLFFLRVWTLGDPNLRWQNYARRYQDVTSDEILASVDTNLIRAMQMTTAVFSMFVTETGYIGTGIKELEAGDRVVVFDGAKTPFVLRKADERRMEKLREGESNGKGKGKEKAWEGKELWEVVGDCFVYGFMDGEATGPEWEGRDETFWLA